MYSIFFINKPFNKAVCLLSTDVRMGTWEGGREGGRDILNYTAIGPIGPNIVNKFIHSLRVPVTGIRPNSMNPMEYSYTYISQNN